MKMKSQYRVALAVIAGFVAGGIFSYAGLGGSNAGDAGLLLLPSTLFYGLILAVFLVALEELIFGSPRNKKIALACLLIWVFWAVSTRFNHNFGPGDHPHYCDGVPVEQYPVPLPVNCQY